MWQGMCASSEGGGDRLFRGLESERSWSGWEGQGRRLEVQDLGEGTHRSDLCFGKIPLAGEAGPGPKLGPWRGHRFGEDLRLDLCNVLTSGGSQMGIICSQEPGVHAGEDL